MQTSKIEEVEILLKVFWTFEFFTNLEAVHASLQGADGIDFSHVHDTAHGLETLTAAFADLTITTDDNLFASEHNVGRSLQAVNDRFATRVQIVESKKKNSSVNFFILMAVK